MNINTFIFLYEELMRSKKPQKNDVDKNKP